MALTDNLVNLWELEEASGTRVDSVGGKDFISNVNNPGNTAGINGNALEKIVSTGGVYNSSGFTPLAGDAWTVSMWLFFTNAPGSIEYALTINLGGNLYVVIRREASGVIFGRGSDSTGANHEITGGTVTADSVWTHVALTYTRNDALRLYVNGVEDATPVALPDLAAYAPGSRQTLVGGLNSGASGVVGAIDQVAFFDVALSESDAATIYNNGDGGDLFELGIGGGGSWARAMPAGWLRR